MGANEQITSYGAAGQGRTYTVLNTWEAATDTDHVTDTESDVLECYDDSATFDDRTTLGGSTNDSTHFRIIRAATGEGHDGTRNNGIHFKFTSANNVCLLLDEPYSQVQDLILQIVQFVQLISTSHYQMHRLQN